MYWGPVDLPPPLVKTDLEKPSKQRVKRSKSLLLRVPTPNKTPYQILPPLNDIWKTVHTYAAINFHVFTL